MGEGKSQEPLAVEALMERSSILMAVLDLDPGLDLSEPETSSAREINTSFDLAPLDGF